MRYMFVFLLALALGVLSACTKTVEVSVTFPESKGLREGDRVVFQDQDIGNVASVKPADSGVVAGLTLDSETSRSVQTNAAAIVADTDPRTVEILNPPGTGEPVTDGASLEGLGSPLELALWRTGATIGAGQGLVEQLSATFDHYFDSEQWERTKAEILAQLDTISGQSAQAMESASEGLKAFLAELEVESTEVVQDTQERLAELQEQIETFQKEGQAELAASLKRILEQLDSAVSEPPPPAGG